MIKKTGIWKRKVIPFLDTEEESLINFYKNESNDIEYIDYNKTDTNSFNSKNNILNNLSINELNLAISASFYPNNSIGNNEIIFFKEINDNQEYIEFDSKNQVVYLSQSCSNKFANVPTFLYWSIQKSKKDTLLLLENPITKLVNKYKFTFISKDKDVLILKLVN